MIEGSESTEVALNVDAVQFILVDFDADCFSKLLWLYELVESNRTLIGKRAELPAIRLKRMDANLLTESCGIDSGFKKSRTKQEPRSRREGTP